MEKRRARRRSGNSKRHQPCRVLAAAAAWVEVVLLLDARWAAVSWVELSQSPLFGTKRTGNTLQCRPASWDFPSQDTPSGPDGRGALQNPCLAHRRRPRRSGKWWIWVEASRLRRRSPRFCTYGAVWDSTTGDADDASNSLLRARKQHGRAHASRLHARRSGCSSSVSGSSSSSGSISCGSSARRHGSS